MKRTHLGLIITYFLIMLYFAAFNWDIFTVNLNISLGFALFRVPLIIFLFLSGLIILLFEWLLFKMSSLKMERDAARLESELNKLKAVQFDSQLNDTQKILENQKQLHHHVSSVLEKFDVDQRDKIEIQHPAETNNNLNEDSESKTEEK